MEELTKAIEAAKKRTGDIIAVALKAGKAQVQKIEYDNNGKSEVTGLSDYMHPSKVIDFLNKL